MSHLFETAFFLVSFVTCGLVSLHADLHVSLENLTVLTLLLSHRHEVTTVVGLILDRHDKRTWR